MKAVRFFLFVVAGALLVGIGWYEGINTTNMTNTMPQLTGYHFTGTASYTAKDPNGNAVQLHYERQKNGFVIYIVADKLPHDSSSNGNGSNGNGDAPKIEIYIPPTANTVVEDKVALIR